MRKLANLLERSVREKVTSGVNSLLFEFKCFEESALRLNIFGYLSAEAHLLTKVGKTAAKVSS